MEASQPLRAPFPWFGGKSRVADVVWERFGNVPNYVEPFAGSLAVLLARPHAPRCETVNDKDCMIANFWRALAAVPEELAHWADWPVNEADLHARHKWLVEREDFAERVKTEADFYDAKIAGWWVWGLSMWIGAEWCQKRPDLKSRGVWRKRISLRRGAKGVQRVEYGPARQVPDLGGNGGAYGRGVHRCGLDGLLDYFNSLAARLRRVRICCGEWNRVLGPSPTFKIGTTAILLDPPYGAPDRDDVYREEDWAVSVPVREWAIANGNNPQLRIALCGYEGEHEMPEGWQRVEWKANGGYGNAANGTGRKNAKRERIWFSPHCLQPRERELFEMGGMA